MTKLKRQIFCTIAMLLISCFAVRAGSFYVVIASFAHESQASHFSGSIASVFANASSLFDKNRNMYHVSVMETNNARDAEHFRKHLREISGFRNAWIFAEGIAPYASYVSGEGSSSDLVTLELYTGSTVLLSSADNSYLTIEKNKGDVQQAKAKASASAFAFIAKTLNGHLLPAQVFLFDRTGHQISIFKTNEVVRLNGKNGMDRIIAVCKLRGYGTETKIIDLKDPAASLKTSHNENGVWQVRFNMSRIRPDKVEFVYRGLFLEHASVMQPHGKNNLEVLLGLLRSNPEWRIVINSHTTPGDKRQIAVAAPENVFDATLAEFKKGSDKELTEERAQVLEAYLISGGIDKKRITVMGWGSLAMVARPDEEDGHLNDRVEVDLLMN